MIKTKVQLIEENKLLKSRVFHVTIEDKVNDEQSRLLTDYIKRGHLVSHYESVIKDLNKEIKRLEYIINQTDEERHDDLINKIDKFKSLLENDLNDDR